jgi:hypothetical protein
MAMYVYLRMSQRVIIISARVCMGVACKTVLPFVLPELEPNQQAPSPAYEPQAQHV